MARKSVLVVIILAGALVVIAGVFSSAPERAASNATPNHCAWLSATLKEAERVKVGATRSELQEVFAGEGGLSNRRQRTYVYRGCPLIKVDVEFSTAAPPPGDLNTEPGDDVVVKISRPYLAWPVSD